MMTSFVLAGLLLSPCADLKVGDSDWPQWRGPNRDGVSQEKGLLQEWPKDGPTKVWTISGVGGGYSSVSIAGGFIFGTGKKDGQECLWCLKESSGEEVWNVPFADAKRVGYDEGVRSTPTVWNNQVYCVGVAGDLICCAADTGKILWRKSFSKDFQGRMMSGWGYSESVLIDDGKLICTPGSDDAAIVALDAKTGEVLWKSAVKKAGGAGYASAVKMTVGKTDMYVTLLGKSGGTVGVDAKTGKALWQYTKIANGTANIPTPVIKGDMVWTSTGYRDGGSALLKIKPKGDGFEVEELKLYDSNELQNHHGGMVLVGDYIYFGHRHNSGLPACVKFADGEIQWKETRGAAGGSGSGSVVYADGMIYFRYQNDVMALVKANPEKFEVMGSFKIPQPSGKPSWPHPVIANGKLYLRDQDKLHCYDLKAASNE